MAKTYHPPFSITRDIVNLVSRISETVGYMKASNLKFHSPAMKKNNRIKAITATLAIEGNTLSLDQVSNIAEGKPVFGSTLEIAEVHGAIKAYEQLCRFNSSREKDLLKAHALLMCDVLKDAGTYRKGAVGIYKADQVIHVAPQAGRVPQLIRNLLAWLASGNDHPLIQSCVFHYELEFIHPFSDGNGRMGRLWQTLILCKWQQIFEFLPLESLIRKNQTGYYQALRAADQESSSTPFIEFMLDLILQTCVDAAEIKQSVPVNVLNNVSLKRPDQILAYMAENKDITIAQLADLCHVSAKTINRDIARLKNENKIERKGSSKSGYWKVNS